MYKRKKNLYFAQILNVVDYVYLKMSVKLHLMNNSTGIFNHNNYFPLKQFYVFYRIYKETRDIKVPDIFFTTIVLFLNCFKKYTTKKSNILLKEILRGF